MELEPNLFDTGAGASVFACAEGEQESWAAVPAYEGLYEVSSHGRLRRASKSRMAPAGYILKPKLSWDGYPEYALSRHQKYWHVKAHRLVALAFLGPPPFAGAHVAHFDGIKTNNCVANLRWATPTENEADKKRHGRVSRLTGERSPMAKLSVAAVQQLRRDVLAGVHVRTIADQLGVGKVTIYNAIHGTTWGAVSDPPPLHRERGSSRWMSN